MVKTATLYRLEKSDAGTFGALVFDGHALCVTLEPPDLGNQSDISCIPEGRYRCEPVYSPHFGNTYAVTDVPNRTHILFHSGNLCRDTHGCILLGRKFGQLGNERAVLVSRKACEEFMTRAGVEPFDLRIADVSRV